MTRLKDVYPFKESIKIPPFVNERAKHAQTHARDCVVMNDETGIFALTWNTQSVDYSTRDGIEPDFIEALKSRIPSSAWIVAIGLQEETSRGSLLGSGSCNNNDEPYATGRLTDSLSSSGFERVGYVDMMGWGVTTYKKLIREFKYEPRGLVLAVYVKRTHLDRIESVDISTDTCPGLIQRILRSKGAVSICVHLRPLPNDDGSRRDQNTDAETTAEESRIVFTNAHLPFDSHSIRDNCRERIGALTWQLSCFKYLYNNARQRYSPTHHVFMGDLNFRTTLPDPIDSSAPASSNTDSGCSRIENDELTVVRTYGGENDDSTSNQRLSAQPLSAQPLANQPFVGLREGVNDVGPTFEPTAKMEKTRFDTTVGDLSGSMLGTRRYRVGKDRSRLPSWTDRILYETSSSVMNQQRLDCLEYEAFDYGNMDRSDHIAVYSVLGITSLSRRSILSLTSRQV